MNGLISLTAQNNKSNIFQLSAANASISVDTQYGARISSLQIDGYEILYLDTASGYWGSTFWPSPQSIWNWPPPAKLDSQPYSVSYDGNKIVLKSDVDEITHLSVIKTIMLSEKDTAFVISYTMINHDTIVHKYAPWEITRVPSKGVVFAAKNSLANDYLWFDLNEPFAKKSKVISDGEGWLAYVNNEGYIFIKTYNDILPQEAAPGEAEFELYRDTNLYVELENQGKYQAIEPGGSLVWDVKWYLRKLPEQIIPELGNMQLVEFVLQYLDKDAKHGKQIIDK